VFLGHDNVGIYVCSPEDALRRSQLVMERLPAVISMRIDGHWLLQIRGWMDEASPQRWLVVKGACQFLLGEFIPQVV
jgi:hypothetical protein